MAMSVRPWVDTDMIQDWANELSYNTKHEKDANYLKSTPHGSGSAGGGAGGTGGGGGGAGGGLGGIISGLGSSIGGIVGSWLSSLGAFISGAGIGTGLGARNSPEGATVYEEQGALSQVMQLNLNMMMNTASIFLVILGAYQLVMICYLLLLGPLAAAFYAWPQVTGSGKLFRNVFGSWVEGVLQVSLWRFYWMVVPPLSPSVLSTLTVAPPICSGKFACLHASSEFSCGHHLRPSALDLELASKS